MGSTRAAGNCQVIRLGSMERHFAWYTSKAKSSGRTGYIRRRPLLNSERLELLCNQEVQASRSGDQFVILWVGTVPSIRYRERQYRPA